MPEPSAPLAFRTHRGAARPALAAECLCEGGTACSQVPRAPAGGMQGGSQRGAHFGPRCPRGSRSSACLQDGRLTGADGSSPVHEGSSDVEGTLLGGLLGRSPTRWTGVGNPPVPVESGMGLLVHGDRMKIGLRVPLQPQGQCRQPAPLAGVFWRQASRKQRSVGEKNVSTPQDSVRSE